MSDENVSQEQETGLEEKKTEPSIQDLMVQMESLKNAQSGSDKKVTELSEALTQAHMENETLKKEQMSDKEVAKFELEKREQALAEKDALIKAKELAIERTSVLAELEMPQDFAKWVTGNNRVELTANAMALKGLFDAKVIEVANANLVNTVIPPKTGDPVLPNTKFESKDAGGSDEFAEFLKTQKKGA